LLVKINQNSNLKTIMLNLHRQKLKDYLMKGTFLFDKRGILHEGLYI